MVYLSRLNDLIIKLVSFKGLVFTLATVFLLHGKIDQTTWWLAAITVTATRAVEKKIHEDAEKGVQ